MKTLTITILIFILSGPILACNDEEGSRLRYNALENTWGYESSQDTLRYNSLEDTWGYEDPESHLKYNPLEDCWEYAR